MVQNVFSKRVYLCQTKKFCELQRALRFELFTVCKTGIYVGIQINPRENFKTLTCQLHIGEDIKNCFIKKTTWNYIYIKYF